MDTFEVGEFSSAHPGSERLSLDSPQFRIHALVPLEGDHETQILVLDVLSYNRSEFPSEVSRKDILSANARGFVTPWQTISVGWTKKWQPI